MKYLVENKQVEASSPREAVAKVIKDKTVSINSIPGSYHGIKYIYSPSGGYWKKMTRDYRVWTLPEYRQV